MKKLDESVYEVAEYSPTDLTNELNASLDLPEDFATQETTRRPH